MSEADDWDGDVDDCTAEQTGQMVHSDDGSEPMNRY